MFDARGSQGRAGGLGFGLLVVGIVAALFFAVLFMPSLTGPGKSRVADKAAPPDPEAANILEATFSDETTLDYIGKLRRTFPSAAADLEADIRKASTRGAGKVELGLLVMQAGAEDIYDGFERLARADVKYFNQLLDLTGTALQDLTRSGAPYCKGSDLMAFASLSEQDLYAAIFDRVGHGAGLYEFGLEFNGILLDAMRDARADPVLHSGLARPDQQALQTLGLTLMTDPQIMQLLTTEGKSRREMDRVMENVNFCQLGVKVIREVDALPDVTKGRLWALMMRQAANGGWRRAIYRLNAY